MDGFTEIAVFVQVVALRSFTGAANVLGMTPSGVSRVVARLEDRLGVRLLNRTTRSVTLTDDGASYYERCTSILAQLEEANLTMDRARAHPRGKLRVDAPSVLGEFVLGPAVNTFLTRYPEVSLDLSVRDHIIDPVAEGIDIVLRMTTLRDSSLIAKKLGTVRTVFAAAPGYLERQGRPLRPEDLRDHSCVGYLLGTTVLPWRYRNEGAEHFVDVSGRFHTNSGPALREAARAGLGIVSVFEFHVAEDVRSGALELVLREHEPEPRAIYALYPHQKHAAPKVTAFLEFLEELFASELPLRGPQRPRPRSRADAGAKAGARGGKR